VLRYGFNAPSSRQDEAGIGEFFTDAVGGQRGVTDGASFNQVRTFVYVINFDFLSKIDKRREGKNFDTADIAAD
jgi:hypothetical protein